MTEKHKLMPAQLAQVAPCDWDAAIERCRGMLADMEAEDRQEYIDAQSHEVNYRRSVAIADAVFEEIEAEIASLQSSDTMAVCWEQGGSREWPGQWPPAG